MSFSQESQGQLYCITQVNDKNKSRLEFENSERFREKLKIRHRIEKKNGEMKNTRGLRRADSTGLFAMRRYRLSQRADTFSLAKTMS